VNSNGQLQIAGGENRLHSRAVVADRLTPATKIRVALLTNEIPPYAVAKYRALAATPDWDFQVFTCVQRERHRLWKVQDDLPFAMRRSFSLSYVRTTNHDDQGFVDQREVHLPLGLPWDLWRFDPDVIISGELGARTLIAAWYSRLRRRTLLVRFEGTPHTERHLTRFQRCIRRLIRGAPQAYLVNGVQGRQYLESLGTDGAKIYEVGQSTDTELFAATLDPEERESLREKLGIRGHCYLFCGMLIPLKGLDQLLDAWIEFTHANQGERTLLLVGDGPERSRLLSRVEAAGLRNVQFLNHVERRELPPIYQAADVFVLPTLQDCWALVFEEALASGLPVINSIYNGSAERIVEGETGWLVDPLDRADMANKLQLAWEVRNRQAAMRDAARAASAKMSIPAAAERFRQVVKLAVQTVKPRGNDAGNNVQPFRPQ
jgi:glycosyltransferase involved in cell wall biosynthesis